MIKKEKIRFTLVGCGRIGERHAQHINNLATLAAVCDIDPKKAQKFGSLYSVPAFSSHKELLDNFKDFDVVSVCSPNGTHAEHTIDSLKAGYHVVCEKPMALSVQDCGEMIKCAESANKRLFIVKQNRFNPPVAAVKQAIDDGKLGKIYSIQLNCFWNRNFDYYKNSWKGTKDMDGGSLYTQFSHFVDLLYWMVGDVRDVRSYTRNYAHEGVIEFEDTGVVILEFYNGAVGAINFTINSYNKNMEGSLTIFGEKGSVKIGGQYLNELEYQNIRDFEIKDLPAGNPPNNYGQYQGSMSNHDKVYENVIAVLSHQGVIATNGFEGLKTVEIIDRIYSAANQR